MPIASVSRTTVVKIGVRRSVRAAVAEVARQVVDPGQAALIAQRVHRLCDTAPCRIVAVRRRAVAVMPARRRFVLGGEIEVEPQFFLELGIAAPAADRAPEPGAHSRSAVGALRRASCRAFPLLPAHTWSFSNVCMIDDMRSQSRPSPFFVRHTNGVSVCSIRLSNAVARR